MNEHDHHTPEGPTGAQPPRDDLEDRLHAVSQEQLRRLSDLDAGEDTTPMEALHTVSLDGAPTHAETNVSVVREGIRRYGQPFLAYLILDGVEQRSADLIEQFERRFAGSHPDRESFARWAIRDMGWAQDLEELRRLQGLWLDDVKWNLDELWPTLIERYAITERLGGVHAFRR